jgi:hypothetical protein
MEKKIKKPRKRRMLKIGEEEKKPKLKIKKPDTAFFKDWNSLKREAKKIEKKTDFDSLPNSFFMEANDKEASLLYAWIKANNFEVSDDYFQTCILGHKDLKGNRIISLSHPNLRNAFKDFSIISLNGLDLEAVAKGLLGSFWKNNKQLVELVGFDKENHQVVLKTKKAELQVEAYKFFTTYKFNEILNIDKPNLEWAIYSSKKKSIVNEKSTAKKSTTKRGRIRASAANAK